LARGGAHRVAAVDKRAGPSRRPLARKALPQHARRTANVRTMAERRLTSVAVAGVVVVVRVAGRVHAVMALRPGRVARTVVDLRAMR